MSHGLRNTFTNILAFTKNSEDSVWHTFKTKLVTHPGNPPLSPKLTLKRLELSLLYVIV